MEFWSLVFLGGLYLVRLSWTLSFTDFPLGTSENSPRVTFVHPGIIVPPPGVLLRKIQCVVICVSSEDIWSHFALMVSWFYYDKSNVHLITYREGTKGGVDV